jgi:glycosyltransferase involved in cell wall biosynthesis
MPESRAEVARATAWLEELAIETRPDVVHVNSVEYANGAFGAPVVVTAHTCACIRWRAVHHTWPPADVLRTDRAAEEAGLAAATVVAVTTQAMAAALETEHHLGRPPVVIPNGIELARVAPRRKNALILTAGRESDPAKNVAAVERVAADLSWPVWIANSTPSPAIAAPRPGAAVRLGPLDEPSLRGLMASASIFALPARYEPFGLSILEAAQAGCALVLGDIPSLRENWEDAAVFVDPEDPADLRGALEALVADPAGRERLRRLACARARHFRAARCADAYADLYWQCVSPRRWSSTSASR